MSYPQNMGEQLNKAYVADTLNDHVESSDRPSIPLELHKIEVSSIQ